MADARAANAGVQDRQTAEPLDLLLLHDAVAKHYDPARRNIAGSRQYDALDQMEGRAGRLPPAMKPEGDAGQPPQQDTDEKTQAGEDPGDGHGPEDITLPSDAAALALRQDVNAR
jgi:hypothetical protein